MSIPAGLVSEYEDGTRHSDHSRLLGDGDDADEAEDEMSPFIGLNALEIAAVADAKKFLSRELSKGSWMISGMAESSFGNP